PLGGGDRVGHIKRHVFEPHSWARMISELATRKQLPAATRCDMKHGTPKCVRISSSLCCCGTIAPTPPTSTACCFILPAKREQLPTSPPPALPNRTLIST